MKCNFSVKEKKVRLNAPNSTPSTLFNELNDKYGVEKSLKIYKRLITNPDQFEGWVFLNKASLVPNNKFNTVNIGKAFYVGNYFDLEQENGQLVDTEIVLNKVLEEGERLEDKIYIYTNKDLFNNALSKQRLGTSDLFENIADEPTFEEGKEIAERRIYSNYDNFKYTQIEKGKSYKGITKSSLQGSEGLLSMITFNREPKIELVLEREDIKQIINAVPDEIQTVSYDTVDLINTYLGLKLTIEDATNYLDYLLSGSDAYNEYLFKSLNIQIQELLSYQAKELHNKKVSELDYRQFSELPNSQLWKDAVILNRSNYDNLDTDKKAQIELALNTEIDNKILDILRDNKISIDEFNFVTSLIINDLLINNMTTGTYTTKDFIESYHNTLGLDNEFEKFQSLEQKEVEVSEILNVADGEFESELHNYIFEEVINKLQTFFGISLDNEYYEELEDKITDNINEQTEQFDRDTTRTTGFSFTQKEFRDFLSFIPYKDNGTLKMVDGTKVFRLLQYTFSSKLLVKSNLFDEFELMLETLSKTNPQVKALKERYEMVKPLFPGITELFINEISAIPKLHYQVVYDPNSNQANIFNSNNNQSDIKQVREWGSRNRLIRSNNLKVENAITALKQDNEVNIATIKNYLNNIGISLANGTIKYLILNSKENRTEAEQDFIDYFDGAEGTDWLQKERDNFTQFLRTIDNKLKENQDIFSREQGVTLYPDMIKLAKINLLFDDSLVESSFKNSANDTIFSYGKPTHIDYVTRWVRNEEFRNNLRTQEDNFYFSIDNHLLSLPQEVFNDFQTVLAGNIRQAVIDKNDAALVKKRNRTETRKEGKDFKDAGNVAFDIVRISYFLDSKFNLNVKSDNTSMTVRRSLMIPMLLETSNTSLALPFVKGTLVKTDNKFEQISFVDGKSISNEGKRVLAKIYTDEFVRAEKRLKYTTKGLKELALLMRSLKYDVPNTDVMSSLNYPLLENYDVKIKFEGEEGKPKVPKIELGSAFSTFMVKNTLVNDTLNEWFEEYKAIVKRNEVKLNEYIKELYENGTAAEPELEPLDKQDYTALIEEVGNYHFKAYESYVNELIDKKLITKEGGELKNITLPIMQSEEYNNYTSLESMLLDFVLNEFIYRHNFHELITGDLATSKGFDDLVKRNKLPNGAGNSVHPEAIIKVASIHEPSFEHIQFGKIDRADAQTFGNIDFYTDIIRTTRVYSEKIQLIYQKIRLGLDITHEDKKYLEKNKVALNNYKDVLYQTNYAHKDSIHWLSPNLTSYYPIEVKEQVKTLMEEIQRVENTKYMRVNRFFPASVELFNQSNNELPFSDFNGEVFDLFVNDLMQSDKIERNEAINRAKTLLEQPYWNTRLYIFSKYNELYALSKHNGSQEKHELRLNMFKFDIKLVSPPTVEKRAKPLKLPISYVSSLGRTHEQKVQNLLLTTTKINALNMKEALSVPSGKSQITYFTQVIKLIVGEQNNNTLYELDGEYYEVGEILNEYRQVLGDKKANSFFDALKYLVKDFEDSDKYKRSSDNLQLFYNKMASTLELSNERDLLVRLFKDVNFNLNSPITAQKFVELLVSQFNKGVLSQKANGRKFTLVSDVFQELVVELDENGVEINIIEFDKKGAIDLKTKHSNGQLKYKKRRLKYTMPEFSNKVVVKTTVNGKLKVTELDLLDDADFVSKFDGELERAKLLIAKLNKALPEEFNDLYKEFLPLKNKIQQVSNAYVSELFRTGKIEGDLVSDDKLLITDFTNHSGGADGADIEWDKVGKTFNMLNNIHYYAGTISDKNAPFGNKEVKENSQDFKEGKIEAAKAAKRNWGYALPSMTDVRLIRNWSQVKYSDAVFAISNIVGKGENVFPDQKNDTRIALLPSVTGGTGYAVGMAIIHNKPVYVFNQTQGTYNIGWYKWDSQANDFVAIDTPVLTKNFAGIGTREINEQGKQAIRDVYENTINSLNTDAEVQQVNTDIEIKPIEISSKAKEQLGKDLTNVHYATNGKTAFDIVPSDKTLVSPESVLLDRNDKAVKWAIDKGLKTYKDAYGHSVEAWYKANSAKTKGITEGQEGDNYDFNLMVGLIKDKLTQHSKLISNINEKGGLEFIKQSTHSIGNGRWSSKGKNMFIKALSEAFSKVNTQTQVSNAQTIYNELGNKTESGNVVVDEVNGRKPAFSLLAKEVDNAKKLESFDNGISSFEKYRPIVAYRTRGNDFLSAYEEDNAIGNPFSHKNYSLVNNVGSVQDAVEMFIMWVTGDIKLLDRLTDKQKADIAKLKPYRTKLQNDLKSGKFKGKPILYYKELNEPSHATALDYLINKYDWENTSKQVSDKVTVKPKQTKPNFQIAYNIGDVSKQGFAEAMITVPNKDFEDYFYNLEYFATRIPAQDKHSMFVFKPVQKLPKEYGDSAIVPLDIIAISGADFDIDSIYSITKEFYVGRDINGKPYLIDYSKINEEQATKYLVADLFKVEYEKYMLDELNKELESGNSLELLDRKIKRDKARIDILEKVKRKVATMPDLIKQAEYKLFIEYTKKNSREFKEEKQLLLKSNLIEPETKRAYKEAKANVKRLSEKVNLFYKVYGLSVGVFDSLKLKSDFLFDTDTDTTVELVDTNVSLQPVLELATLFVPEEITLNKDITEEQEKYEAIYDLFDEVFDENKKEFRSAFSALKISGNTNIDFDVKVVLKKVLTNKVFHLILTNKLLQEKPAQAFKLAYSEFNKLDTSSLTDDILLDLPYFIYEYEKYIVRYKNIITDVEKQIDEELLDKLEIPTYGKFKSSDSYVYNQNKLVDTNKMLYLNSGLLEIVEKNGKYIIKGIPTEPAVMDYYLGGNKDDVKTGEVVALPNLGDTLSLAFYGNTTTTVSDGFTSGGFGKSFKDVKEAKGFIGFPALYAPLFQFLNGLAKFQTNTTDKMKDGISLNPAFRFKIDGVEYDTIASSWGEEYAIGIVDGELRVIDKVTIRQQDANSASLSAATDNPTHKITAKLNVDINLFSYVLYMRMVGVPLSVAYSMMQLPIIQDEKNINATKEFELKGSKDKNSYNYLMSISTDVKDNTNYSNISNIKNPYDAVKSLEEPKTISTGKYPALLALLNTYFGDEVPVHREPTKINGELKYIGIKQTGFLQFTTVEYKEQADVSLNLDDVFFSITNEKDVMQYFYGVDKLSQLTKYDSYVGLQEVINQKMALKDDKVKEELFDMLRKYRRIVAASMNAYPVFTTIKAGNKFLPDVIKLTTTLDKKLSVRLSDASGYEGVALSMDKLGIKEEGGQIVVEPSDTTLFDMSLLLKDYSVRKNLEMFNIVYKKVIPNMVLSKKPEFQVLNSLFQSTLSPRLAYSRKEEADKMTSAFIYTLGKNFYSKSFNINLQNVFPFYNSKFEVVDGVLVNPYEDVVSKIERIIKQKPELEKLSLIKLLTLKKGELNADGITGSSVTITTFDKKDKDLEDAINKDLKNIELLEKDLFDLLVSHLYSKTNGLMMNGSFMPYLPDSIHKSISQGLDRIDDRNLSQLATFLNTTKSKLVTDFTTTYLAYNTHLVLSFNNLDNYKSTPAELNISMRGSKLDSEVDKLELIVLSSSKMKEDDNLSRYVQEVKGGVNISIPPYIMVGNALYRRIVKVYSEKETVYVYQSIPIIELSNIFPVFSYKDYIKLMMDGIKSYTASTATYSSETQLDLKLKGDDRYQFLQQSLNNFNEPVEFEVSDLTDKSVSQYVLSYFKENVNDETPVVVFYNSFEPNIATNNIELGSEEGLVKYVEGNTLKAGTMSSMLKEAKTDFSAINEISKEIISDYLDIDKKAFGLRFNTNGWTTADLMLLENLYTIYSLQKGNNYNFVYYVDNIDTTELVDLEVVTFLKHKGWNVFTVSYGTEEQNGLVIPHFNTFHHNTGSTFKSNRLPDNTYILGVENIANAKSEIEAAKVTQLSISGYKSALLSKFKTVGIKDEFKGLTYDYNGVQTDIVNVADAKTYYRSNYFNISGLPYQTKLSIDGELQSVYTPETIIKQGDIVITGKQANSLEKYLQGNPVDKVVLSFNSETSTLKSISRFDKAFLELKVNKPIKVTKVLDVINETVLAENVKKFVSAYNSFSVPDLTEFNESQLTVDEFNTKLNLKDKVKSDEKFIKDTGFNSIYYVYNTLAKKKDEIGINGESGSQYNKALLKSLFELAMQNEKFYDAINNNGGLMLFDVMQSLGKSPFFLLYTNNTEIELLKEAYINAKNYVTSFKLKRDVGDIESGFLLTGNPIRLIDTDKLGNNVMLFEQKGEKEVNTNLITNNVSNLQPITNPNVRNTVSNRVTKTLLSSPYNMVLDALNEVKALLNENFEPIDIDIVSQFVNSEETKSNHILYDTEGNKVLNYDDLTKVIENKLGIPTIKKEIEMIKDKLNLRPKSNKIVATAITFDEFKTTEADVVIMEATFEQMIEIANSNTDKAVFFSNYEILELTVPLSTLLSIFNVVKFDEVARQIIIANTLMNDSNQVTVVNGMFGNGDYKGIIENLSTSDNLLIDRLSKRAKC